MGSTRWLGAAVLGVAMLGPSPAPAITIFGDPPAVSPGQARSLPFTLFGEQVTPRLDVDGFLRYQIVGFRTGGTDHASMVPEISLDVNMKLTATQRIHALLRPIEEGTHRPTVYTFAPEESGWTVRTQAEHAALWYEGQPFNWLTPRDAFPLDISVAGGRLPLFLHNGLWFDNIFDGFALSKLNLQIGNLSNLNLIYFLTRGQTQGGETEVERRETRKNVTGLVAYADWYDYHLEASWARAYDNDRTAEFPEDRDRHFWGISVTRTFGDAGISVRVLGSTGNDSRGQGELFVLETVKGFEGFRVYANFFAGTEDWLPVSVEGSRTNRLGILFTQDRLAAFPGLSGFGGDSAGGVVGVIFNPRGIITFTPEAGFVVDHSRRKNDQFGVGFQAQADVASLVIPGRTLAETQRRGLLYGLLARVTLVGIQNRNDESGESRGDYGGRFELIYKF
ncbi:MAG: hypothetical protein HYV62_02490 [Candidatus Rokubacteria bacterium]|nr:hypothetical protein [Candidatus Rokubacteria bacterium]